MGTIGQLPGRNLRQVLLRQAEDRVGDHGSRVDGQDRVRVLGPGLARVLHAPRRTLHPHGPAAELAQVLWRSQSQARPEHPMGRSRGLHRRLGVEPGDSRPQLPQGLAGEALRAAAHHRLPDARGGEARLQRPGCGSDRLDGREQPLADAAGPVVALGLDALALAQARGRAGSRIELPVQVVHLRFVLPRLRDRDGL